MATALELAAAPPETARRAPAERRWSLVGIGAIEGSLVSLLLGFSALSSAGTLPHPAATAVLLGAVAVGVVPWAAVARRGAWATSHEAGLAASWALTETMLVCAVVAVEGGARSTAYLALFPLTAFVGTTGWSSRRVVPLVGLVLAGYLAALGVSGSQLARAEVMLRAGMLAATALAVGLVSVRFHRTVAGHRAESESREQAVVALQREVSDEQHTSALMAGRAATWSLVAKLGRQAGTLDEREIASWAVAATIELGYDLAALVRYEMNGEAIVVERMVGPDIEIEALRLPCTTLGQRLRAAGRTLVVEDYRTLTDVVGAASDAGLRSVVGSPVWSVGTMRGYLVAGTRVLRRSGDEEVAALDLLAAHVGHALERTALLASQRRDADWFRTLIEDAPDALIVLDRDGTVVDLNHQAERVYGYRAEELRGRSSRILVPTSLRPALRDVLDEVVRERSVAAMTIEDELTGLRKDGTEFPIELTMRAIEGIEGLFLTASIRDVTERREMERRLAHQASHDHLTGLPNRTLFLDRLAATLRGTTSKGRPAAVFFLDVDHFKYVNDSRGHLVGDRLLVEVADRIAAAARPGDIVARFGGDEFAVLAAGLDGRPEAVAYGWRLLAALDPPFVLDGVDCYVSASGGVAFGTLGDDPHGILRDADAAMFQAKQTGRAKIELFDDALTARAAERLAIESELHQAVHRGELFLVYQPLVDTASRRMAGVEALLRWEHPNRGLVPPLGFIPVAEESGLILTIGRWVLLEACRQGAQWLGSVRSPRFSVSVNISSRQLEHDRMIADVARALDHSGLHPSSLVLEITESFFIQDVPAAVRRLNALKELGVRIAIDDFGTGFSSLSSLSRLPVDIVKIDKSFIDGLGTRSDAVIRAVVQVADAFELEVVAEGIEQPAQLERLVDLGCTHGQGFLFCPPVAADTLVSLTDHRFGGAEQDPPVRRGAAD